MDDVLTSEVQSQCCSEFGSPTSVAVAADCPGRGRVLIALRDFSSAEDIFLAPIECSSLRDSDAFSDFECFFEDLHQLHGSIGPPIVYWAALASLLGEEVRFSDAAPCAATSLKIPQPRLSSASQSRLLCLHRPTVTSKWTAKAAAPSEELGAISVDPMTLSLLEHLNLEISPTKFEALVHVWQYNSFCQGAGQKGRELYFAPSFCNHSCAPSCSFYRGEDGFAVSASLNGMRQGDELTISYLQQDSLALIARDRRELLAQSWLFFCECCRCTSEAPMPECAGCGLSAEPVISEEWNLPSAVCCFCELDNLAHLHSYFFFCSRCRTSLCPWCASESRAGGEPTYT